jgi:hypothetical protein
MNVVELLGLQDRSLWGGWCVIFDEGRLFAFFLGLRRRCIEIALHLPRQEQGL